MAPSEQESLVKSQKAFIMRYIPNLIPKQFRVLPERFKGSTTKLPPQQTSTGRILSYVGFGIVAFFALGSIMHPWLFIVLGIFAFLLLPYGSRRIEQFLHFRFTRRIKRIAVCFFIGISLPLFYHYGQVDFKEQEIVRIAEEAKKAQELADEQMENQRKEAFRVAFASLNY